MRQEVMDALALQMAEQKVRENPEDDEYRRLYSLMRNATIFGSLTTEKQEAVLAELDEWENG